MQSFHDVDYDKLNSLETSDYSIHEMRTVFLSHMRLQAVYIIILKLSLIQSVGAAY